MIQAQNVRHRYESDDGMRLALDDISLHIAKGEFVAILGENGCGKSTFARLCNCLIPLQEGTLRVAQIDTRDSAHLYELRKRCGMVFQNPDNQFVSGIVEEDIAFGLENYEVPRRQIPQRVAMALHRVALDGFEERATHTLSGGQKQRLAIAGVLALEPDVIIFDESTSMLDPMCRSEVCSMMHKLHDMGHTIIMITHYVEEALDCDRVILLQAGRVIASGTPRQVLCNKQQMHKANLLMPYPARLYYDLLESGIELDSCPLTEDELEEVLCRSM